MLYLCLTQVLLTNMTVMPHFVYQARQIYTKYGVLFLHMILLVDHVPANIRSINSLTVHMVIPGHTLERASNQLTMPNISARQNIHAEIIMFFFFIQWCGYKVIAIQMCV